MKKNVYGIRELSELAGVSARTLRYYDEIGLLKPLYTEASGYRFYGEREAELLWQILFYRERGLELKQIQKILYEKDFDIVKALEEQLAQLQEERDKLDMLIRTVVQTIHSKKGDFEMSDQEKFAALKERAVRENEERYGEEIRERYGAETAEQSNRKLLDMTQEEWKRFRELEEEIREMLKKNVLEGISPKSREAGELVRRHKEWLNMTWPSYSAKAHEGVASMYVCDERFRSYYDRETEGCAAFLEQAVRYWAGRLENES